MQINISPCGLVCSRCGAYCATRENSTEKIKMVAEDWKKRYNLGDVQLEDIYCDGCMTEGGRKCFHCANSCPIRPCAVVKGVQICSECTEYPCTVIVEFFEHIPAEHSRAMQKMLEAIVDVEKQMH